MFQNWVLHFFDGFSYSVRTYGSEVLFPIAAILLITYSVLRETSVDGRGSVGRGRTSRILLVTTAVIFTAACLLTAYRIFSRAL